MSLAFTWGSSPGNLGNAAVRLGKIDGLVQVADRGQFGSCSLPVDDPSGSVLLAGLDPVLVGETAATNTRVWTGYAAERDVARGDDSLILGAARRWQGALVDLNAAFTFKVIRGTSAKRPAETVDARIAWILGYASGFPDNGLVSSSSLVLSATDYTAMFPNDVFNDCGELTGYNYFRYYDETANESSLAFFPNSYTGYDSTLRLTNVAADVNGSTTFGAIGTLNQDPSDRYNGVLVIYNGGQVFVTSGSGDDRQTSITKDTISSAAHATAFGQRFLDEHSVDVDHITAICQLPKAHVNDAMPGQRMQVKFSHLPGYTSYTYMRIAQRTVAQDKETDELYTVTFDLRDPRSTGGAGSGGGFGGGGGSVGNPGPPAPPPPPFVPCPPVPAHWWSGTITTTGAAGGCASKSVSSDGTQLVGGVHYNVHFTCVSVSGATDGTGPVCQGQIGVGSTCSTNVCGHLDCGPNFAELTSSNLHAGESYDMLDWEAPNAANGDLTYAFVQVDHSGLAAPAAQITFYVDPVGWEPDDDCDDVPLLNQMVSPELVDMADGDTSGQTNFPYASGGLHIFVSGYGEVIVTETDAATGTFTLPFPKPDGSQVYGWYIAGAGPATGAANTQPVSELDFVPPELLGSGADRSGDNVLHDDWTWGPVSSGSGLEWFNVKDYGAVGDATTDDTSAINGAIAALNAAGQGVLYFPAATAYKCSSALTTLSVPCTVLGDGGAGDPIYSNPVSQVRQTSATANLFTVSATGVAFQNISLRNIAGSTPSAGAGISFASASWARIENCTISRFYDDISISDGIGWTLTNTFIYDPVRYGIRVQGTLSPDNGDQSIVGCYFMADSHAGNAAIRYESAGGLKIANTKINNRTNSFVHGIDLAIPTSVDTGVLHVTGCSIENVTGDAIHGTTSAATSKFSMISLVGLEVALYGNNTGRAVSLVATTAADFADIVIDGCNFRTDGTARAAVAITNVDNITFGDIQLTGFNARYTATTSTNITDSISVSYATPSIALGSSAAAGAASTVIRSDSTIAAFDATAPVSQALGDSAAVGSAAFAARRDHRHGMPALSTATPLVESGSGAVGTGTASSREDHVHPAVTGGGTDHEHIDNVTFSGDGSTTVFELPAAPFDAYSVAAYVAGVRVGQSLSGTLLTTLTFDAAPASGTNNIVVDIAAAAA